MTALRGVTVMIGPFSSSLVAGRFRVLFDTIVAEV